MEIILFIIATLASIAGAISGVGGGIIIKPVVDAADLLSPDVVNFLSGNTVLAMTLVSLARALCKKNEPIVWRRTAFLGLGAAVGGILGGMLFKHLTSGGASLDRVKWIESICLLVMTVAVIIYVRRKDRIRSLQVNHIVPTLAIGLSLGVISSFLGIGGGPLNIAFLYFFFSMTTKAAVINSLLVIFFSQVFNLGQTLITHSVPQVSWTALAVMVVGAVVGGLFGRSLATKFSERQVNVFFQSFMVLIVLVNIYNVVRIGMRLF